MNAAVLFLFRETTHQTHAWQAWLEFRVQGLGQRVAAPRQNFGMLHHRTGSYGAQAAGHQYLPFAAVAATLLGIGAVYWVNRDRLSAMSHK